MSRVAAAISRRLRPTVRLGGRQWPAYGVAVCGGAVLGLAATPLAAAWAGREALVALAAATAGVAAALALAFGTRAITGRESFTFYHYLLAILAGGAGLLALAGRPVLAALDALAVGLAVTQSVGRLGCLAAGCCHGRPARWGVRYRREHAAEGFQRALVGVPLLPTQALESLALVGLAVAAAALAAGGAAPGAALAVYLAGYAAARFLIERLRGDSRPGLAGLSQAQWIALGTLAATATATGEASLWALAASLGAVALGDRLRRRRTGGLLDSRHLTEVAARLSELGAGGTGGGRIAVHSTSRGLRMSTGTIGEGAGRRRLLTLSRASGSLDGTLAARIAWRIRGIAGAADRLEILAGRRSGVWHLLAPPADEAG